MIQTEDKNKLYDEYKYIVDVIIHKYYNTALSNGVDLKEMESEAYLGLSEALNNYKSDQNSSLATFITICVTRHCQKLIKRSYGQKAQMFNNLYSLDYDYEGQTLAEKISDTTNDPLTNLTTKENYQELVTNIKTSLSAQEYEVFKLYINGLDYQTIALILKKSSKQVDNSIQRIKHKIRDILRS